MQTVYGKPITVPGPWRTMGEVREANARAGKFYFSPDTIRFFRSRPLPTIYHGRFFVDSVVPPGMARVYKIACVEDSGDVERVEPEGMPEFGYHSRSQALAALTQFVTGFIK